MHRIAVIPGDGTGPEVVREGLKVLEAAAQATGFKYETTTVRLRRRALPAHRRDAAGQRRRRAAQVRRHLLGAIGHPDVKPGILEKGILLRTPLRAGPVHQPAPGQALRRASDCPLKDKRPEDIDFVVVRENTEGLYTGTGGVRITRARRTRSPTQEQRQHPPRRRALPALRLRATPRKRNKDEEADARAARPTC